MFLRVYLLVVPALILALLPAPLRGEVQLTELPQPGISILDIKHANDGSNRIFLVGKSGLIKIYKNEEVLQQPFLDFADTVNSSANEQGLLSMAFPPGRGVKTHFYIFYTAADNTSHLSRVRISANPDIAEPASEEVLLRVPQPFRNHNGGRLEFGPDGYLYLGFGDGGGANDPQGNAQDMDTLLGKLIRIDVESGQQPYAVPPDNPFISNPAVLDEIWATGLRNPWRIAFDRKTGDLYIADVGQSSREEINFQGAASQGGENYGWPVMEGSLCNGDCSSFTPPVWDYSHSLGCSVTGGHVYRGSVYPGLQGAYLYGDFCTRTIWALRQVNDGWENQVMATAPGRITTFGEDEAGSLYLASFGNWYLLSDDEPKAAFPISGKISGNWINLELRDQGLNIMAGRRIDGSLFVFLVWLLYDNGTPFWIAGNADYSAGDSEITVPMLRLQGLDFLQPGASADRIAIGDLILRVLNCNRIEADFDFDTFGSGSVDLQRLLAIDSAACS